MTHHIVSIARIMREAQAAAAQPGDINHHCPYPFGSDAAHAFKGFFSSARAAQAAPSTPQTEPA